LIYGPKSNIFDVEAIAYPMEANEFKIRVLPLGQKLHRFASSIIKDVHEAEDIVQEIFLKLWKLKDKLEQIENIDAFAFRMTRNLCLDRIKTKKPQLYDDPVEAGFGEEVAHAPDPEDQVIMQDAISQVHSAMDRLPEQQKTIMHLRDIEGYEYEEIADMLEMEVNNIRVTVSRARKTIRESISKVYHPWKI
jgi:RNA polymerase sigma-70 factor (family 1)